VSGALELTVVTLVVGGALAYVLFKSLRAAKTLAKGQAPSCCTDKDGYAERAGHSACPDRDGAAPGGFVSPCAGCTGCSQGRG
jgi:hypothetical protein